MIVGDTKQKEVTDGGGQGRRGVDRKQTRPGSRDTGTPALPSLQPLPWVSGASGAISLVKGFPSRSEGPSPLQFSRFREITASLKIRHGLISQALDKKELDPPP